MDRLSRAIVVLMLATLLVAACQPILPAIQPPGLPTPVTTPYWPTAGWQSVAPETQGVDSAKLAQALQAIRTRNLQIHSLLIIRNGQILVDAYFYPYDGGTVHDLASVTKSVMTTLIAIAADQGKLQLDQPLVEFFSGRTIANRDARMERITVAHLASMASGLESMGLGQDEGTLTEMQASPDWVQFALDRKVVFEPGTHFVYDSPGMHLLSAVLQQATGMTALDFAQENLFAPLGIEEVIWPADPQGFSHGWGDLYLQPRDAAKIGYLWLNHGMWDGKQIVSQTWVEDSVKTQIKTGRDDNYGYGWWTVGDEGEYAAIGRGGQRIQVWPAINTILVMTGSDTDIDEIEPLLVPAFVDLSGPLPANPDGVTQLEAAIAAVAQPPAARPMASLPDTARAISGKTFEFDANPLEVDALRFEFDESAEASLYVTPAGGTELPPWPIGLDGVYRFSPGDFDLPKGIRGSWSDAQTFAMEYDEIANNGHFDFQIRFDDEGVMIEGQEAAHELGLRVVGRLQIP